MHIQDIEASHTDKEICRKYAGNMQEIGVKCVYISKSALLI